MNENNRTQIVKKNIIGAFFNKALAILISLLLVPITIGYLNTEQYGIWLTISSIVAWISYFDIGLVNGFKNRFAETKAIGEKSLARQYVSTTYILMLIIFSGIIILAECVNPYIEWAKFLNLSSIYAKMLENIVSILLIFVGLQFVLGVLTALLSADQKTAFSSFITTIGQGGALFVIILLTWFTSPNMLYVCLALVGTPCLVLVIFSFYLFCTEYKEYSPSFKFINFKLVGNIFGLGVKFFIIQISMLLIFQVTNVILSRQQGADSVTIYNVTYKYFSVYQMFFNILLTPFWTAYTDAYAKKDLCWMRKTYNKLIKVFLITMPVMALMYILYPYVFEIWLSNKVYVPTSVALGMCLYILILAFSNLLMILINGTGKVFLQMIVYACCALFSIPLMAYLCELYGIVGILMVLGFVYAVQAFFSFIQLNKILNNTSNGIWNK